MLTTGGTIASVVLPSDKEKLNPLWDPIRFARETGANFRRNGAGLGHFLCVDGFGPISKEEQAAGLHGHGEAHRLSLETKEARNENGNRVLTLETELPILQERLTRTYELREGESIVYVRSKLQSLLSFDRPLVWAEHATIGSPFLEAGVTVVDMPAKRAQTRPHDDPAKHRLASGKDFDWPMAPQVDGKPVDVRAAPVTLGSGDHTTCLMDPARKLAYATAIHPQKRLIVGWIWPHRGFPMGPELGKLSDYRQACSRPRVLHAAIRCPSTSGRRHAPDVRHTDIPVDAGEIHCRKIIRVVLRTAAGRHDKSQ